METKLYESKKTLMKLNYTWKTSINYLKKSDTWKIQLTKPVDFTSSKDTDEKCLMHSKSDNIEIMIYNKAGDNWI